MDLWRSCLLQNDFKNTSCAIKAVRVPAGLVLSARERERERASEKENERERARGRESERERGPFTVQVHGRNPALTPGLLHETTTFGFMRQQKMSGFVNLMLTTLTTPRQLLTLIRQLLKPTRHLSSRTRSAKRSSGACSRSPCSSATCLVTWFLPRIPETRNLIPET